jgi:hypothetical protein
MPVHATWRATECLPRGRPLCGREREITRRRRVRAGTGDTMSFSQERARDMNPRNVVKVLPRVVESSTLDPTTQTSDVGLGRQQ